MTTINEREVICPFCGKPVSIVEVMSFSIGEKDSDFFPHYLGANPLPVLVETCPNCGYTAFTSDFDKPLTDREKEKIAKTLHSVKTEKELLPSEKYRILALIKIALGENAVAVADCYLKAAWCERLENNNEAETRALKKALSYFELGLKANEVKGNEELVIRYLVGELARRTNDAEKAQKFWELLREELTISEKTDNWLLQWVNEGLEKIKKQKENDELL